jgi:hypothetical protein
VVTTERSPNPAVVVFLFALLVAAAAAYLYFTKNPPAEPGKSKVIVLPVTPKSEKNIKSANGH